MREKSEREKEKENNLMEVKRHSSETFKRSTHYRTTSAWNDLPKDIDFETFESDSLNNIQKFKNYISNYLVKRRALV